jgi:hypothetical protein
MNHKKGECFLLGINNKREFDTRNLPDRGNDDPKSYNGHLISDKSERRKVTR